MICAAGNSALPGLDDVTESSVAARARAVKSARSRTILIFLRSRLISSIATYFGYVISPNGRVLRETSVSVDQQK